MDDLFDKAKALHEAGELDAAIDVYRQAVEGGPRSHKALNNLGVLYEAQGRLAEAEEAYREALAIEPGAALIHYNLAHAVHGAGRLEEAISGYEAALALDGEMAAGHFNLGQARCQLGQPEAALAAYRRATELDSDAHDAHSQLGRTLTELGRYREAEASCRRALEIRPDSAAYHYHLGYTLQIQVRLEEALVAFEKALECDPLMSPAHRYRALMLQQLGRDKEAEAAYDAWLRAIPGDPVALHLKGALTGAGQASRATDAYVRQTFDTFAADFDATLERLDYRGPALMARALAAACEAPEPRYRILDAGCGTGLCAAYLKPYARELVGVDLSAGMLARARERNLYDELTAAELTAFLASSPEPFDIIVAADTLMYFGELGALLRAAVASLRPGGLFVFTAERLEAADTTYRLQPHGRYAHTESHVRRELEIAGFEIHSLTTEILRRETGRPVVGLLAVAARPSASGTAAA